MRNVTGIAVHGVQALTPAPVFRASDDFASACRLVSGQECFGSAAAVWQAESVSGAVVAGAAGVLGLVALGEGLLARHGYVGQAGQERPRPVFQPVLDGELAPNGGSGISERDYDSSKGDNGTKPMNPWDFRTSAPPG
jgi:hypothetical protein